MLHDATDEQKKLQKELQQQESKSVPGVSNLEAIYLLSQILRNYSKTFLSLTKHKAEASNHFLFSQLSVMQKA